jgi:hypothetical protein
MRPKVLKVGPGVTGDELREKAGIEPRTYIKSAMKARKAAGMSAANRARLKRERR